jgi:4-hydroxybenzoyl-CoA reductase subunit beta
MLRLPKFAVERPTTLDAALALLAEHGEHALVIAGGTDLVPNMKHRLFEPDVVVSLAGIAELAGIRAGGDGGIVVGATTKLARIAESALVRERAPVLAQACGLVAGPQLRNMGTLGGNIALDTRCQWYNQTYFWRKALGFCLKKDGTVCHVVAGGQKCVAAASNDSAPALMTLGASLSIVGPQGRREVPIDEFWLADGIYNKKLARDEILVDVRIPRMPDGHHGAYGKLRERGSIDFPLLGVAVRLDADSGGHIGHADVVLTALQARPIRIRSAVGLLAGTVIGAPSFADAVRATARAAHAQCHPLPNIPGDHDYRREMIPVYVARTLEAAAEKRGPVHHI